MAQGTTTITFYNYDKVMEAVRKWLGESKFELVSQQLTEPHSEDRINNCVLADSPTYAVVTLDRSFSLHLRYDRDQTTNVVALARYQIGDRIPSASLIDNTISFEYYVNMDHFKISLRKEE